MPAIQHIDYLAIAPPLILALAAVAVLVAAAFRPARRSVLTGTALVATLAALAADIALSTGVLGADQPRRTFCVGGSCSYVVDSFTLLFQVVMLVAGIVVLLMAVAEVRDTQLPVGEFSFLLLSTLFGAVTLAAGRDLVTLVVALEVVSLPLFALVALRRYDGRSAEAGLKMFLVSVASTAVMLFGVALVYGVTGSLFLDRIASALAPPGPLFAVAAVGVVFVLVGFGFKIAVVPFHFWAPDTYQGAPVAVAAFLSVVSKAAGFAGLVLVMTVAFGPYATVWGPLVAVLAAVSMTVGNLVALRQRSAMRLVAWSSIAQAGYILAPLGAVDGLVGAAGGADRIAALHQLIAATAGYVAIYAVMNIGVFAVMSWVGWIGQHGGGLLADYRGMARAHPIVAVALAFFLACLAGLPPGLAGLFAKIVVFRGVLTGGYVWLAVVMAVNTVIGLYYYLAWGADLFGASPAGPRDRGSRVSGAAAAAIAIAVAGTVVMSVVPQLVLGIVPFGITIGG